MARKKKRSAAHLRTRKLAEVPQARLFHQDYPTSHHTLQHEIPLHFEPPIALSGATVTPSGANGQFPETPQPTPPPPQTSVSQHGDIAKEPDPFRSLPHPYSCIMMAVNRLKTISTPTTW